ncbi:DMT family transporter [Archaeoglobus neptunius]|uniref:DMT family transporter n=1 Tax=Archaeoglobus neptunius TaxID=2798580 RepID=UPI00192673A7|nr:DMT family transporter [Archaeoglobus neptunius]
MNSEILVLLVPLLFSIHQIFVRLGSGETDTMSGVYISLLASTLIFLPSLLTPTFDPQFLLFMILAGVLHFFIARMCFYHAIARIGANLSAPLSATRVFFAAFLGTFLGETLTPRIALMSFLIFSGIVLLSRPRGKADYVGIALGVLTGFFTALSSFLVKFGYKVEYNPLFGIFVGFAVSTLLMSLLVGKNLSKHGLRWYIAAGITVGFGHLVRYTVLVDLPVTVVEPITSAYPLFTVLLTFIFLREKEVFTIPSIVGTLLILTGIYSYYLG